MKYTLLCLLAITISCSVVADDNAPINATPKTGNIRAFGYYGSTRLPIGYQFFMGFEHIGRMRAGLGLMINNQFSSGAYHDLSGTIFRKNTILNSGKVSDLLSYNVRLRKLQFTEEEAVMLNHKGWYSVILKNRVSLGAGMEYMTGCEEAYGLLLNAGTHFPDNRLSLNANCSFIAGSIDYKAAISKTITVGRSKSTIYGLELSYENFRGYKDMSLGVMIYF